MLTVLIKLLLAPLYQYQITRSRKAIDQQRKLAPEVAALRKKYKNDKQKLNAETMKLYQEHGINPLGQLSGCLPAVLQMPILLGLYYTFLGAARAHLYPAHFLFIPDLNQAPRTHLSAAHPALAIAYFVVPILAAATTFVQSRMIQQPPNPLATEQEAQSQQMTQTMQFIMPAMILYFAFLTPAGLGLYWFVSNCVAIIQQYFVTGWGGLTSWRQASSPASTSTRPTQRLTTSTRGVKRARR